MLKARIAVLVSGGGTNLQALIDAQKAGVLKSGELALVISSNPDAYALTRAAENKIPAAVVSRRDCKTQREFEEKIRAQLKSRGIELIVLAGFMCILSGEFTGAYPRRILNVHPSLIPAFCGKGFYGLRVHEAALRYGVKLTGATVHFVNEVPDGGEIILQKAVPVYQKDTPHTLQRRVMEQAEWKILPKAVELVADKLQKGKNEHEDH